MLKFGVNKESLKLSNLNMNQSLDYSSGELISKIMLNKNSPPKILWLENLEYVVLNEWWIFSTRRQSASLIFDHKGLYLHSFLNLFRIMRFYEENNLRKNIWRKIFYKKSHWEFSWKPRVVKVMYVPYSWYYDFMYSRLCTHGWRYYGSDPFHNLQMNMF